VRATTGRLVSWKPFAPGIVIFLTLWLITWVRWDASAGAQREIDGLWQSIGSEFLADEPLASLRVLHIQPPGLNALYSVDLALTPSSHLFLLALFAVFAVGTIMMIVDTLLRSGLSPRWAMTAGVGYAVLPSTVIYSQWVYVVTPLAFFAMAAIWSISLMRKRPIMGATLSTFAVLAMFLIRPTYAWPVLVAWGVLLAVILLRRGLGIRSLIGLLLAVAIGLGVQVHYVLSFGLPTTSSWSGENLAKALRASESLRVTDAARATINADPCLAAMLAAYESDNLNRWDWQTFRTLPGCRDIAPLAPRGVRAWDEPTSNGVANFNYSEHLVTSRQWTRLMTTIVLSDPTQLFSMALTSKYGPNASGLGLYLSAAEDYPFVTPIRDALPTAVPLGILSLIFAPALWALVVLGWVYALMNRGSPLRRNFVFWTASGFLVFHLLANTLLEYSENMRYRAEIDPVLLVAGVLALAAIWNRKRQRSS
jgi:hypothetical protein